MPVIYSNIYITLTVSWLGEFVNVPVIYSNIYITLTVSWLGEFVNVPVIYSNIYITLTVSSFGELVNVYDVVYTAPIVIFILTQICNVWHTNFFPITRKI